MATVLGTACRVELGDVSPAWRGSQLVRTLRRRRDGGVDDRDLSWKQRASYRRLSAGVVCFLNSVWADTLV